MFVYHQNLVIFSGTVDLRFIRFCSVLYSVCFLVFFNCSFFPSFLLFQSIVLLDLSIISTNYQLKFYFNSVINSRKFEIIV